MKENYEYQLWKVYRDGEYVLVEKFSITKLGFAIEKLESLRKDTLERMITNYTYELLVEEKGGEV